MGAARLDLPLFLHVRDRADDKGGPLGSHEDLLAVLDRVNVKPESVCVHCFTGNRTELEVYVKRGYYIGLTGFVAMQHRGLHLREALKAGSLPLKQLMLETDSPFMKPDREHL